MPRKKKKTQTEKSIWKVGVYCRLSSEDGDNAESDSIGNQRQIIQDFLKNEDNVVIVDYYSDDGYSGTTFNRPEFKRLFNALTNGDINTIIVKDIGLRKKIADTTMLRTVARFMFNNIGNCLSIKKIADTLTSDGRSISVHTVESYLESLVESYVFNKVSRFDIKGKQYLQSGEKYYATDVTMRYALLGRRNIDVGHILENIVYLELIRRGYKVYIGKAGEKEIDFVAENKEGFTYFQVAYTTREKATLERELTPLQDINDHYPKYILTMDIDPIADYDGIKKVNVLDWLLEK